MLQDAAKPLSSHDTDQNVISEIKMASERLDEEEGQKKYELSHAEKSTLSSTLTCPTPTTPALPSQKTPALIPNKSSTSNINDDNDATNESNYVELSSRPTSFTNNNTPSHSSSVDFGNANDRKRVANYEQGRRRTEAMDIITDKNKTQNHMQGEMENAKHKSQISFNDHSEENTVTQQNDKSMHKSNETKNTNIGATAKVVRWVHKDINDDIC